MRIDYFFSLSSPFTYLAGARLEAVAAKHGVAIRYRPMDILELFSATGGVPLPKRHPARRAYRLQDLSRTAKRNGMPIVLQPAHMPTDVAPASHAVIAAQAAGYGVGLLVHGMLRAGWAEERDVAEQAVISSVLAAHDVDEAALRPHLDGASEEYARNTSDAVAMGVFGSPFYVVGEEMFWGQDRLDHLDAHLSEAAV